jgi:hypothetical protein
LLVRSSRAAGSARSFPPAANKNPGAAMTDGTPRRSAIFHFAHVHRPDLADRAASQIIF